MSFKDPGKILDQVAERIQRTELNAEQVSQSAQRAWDRLKREEDSLSFTQNQAVQTEKIRSCQDLQSLIPAYLKKELSDPRRLLVEDHLRECLSCRRVLREARADSHKPAVPAYRSQPSRWSKKFFGWAAAAVVVLGLALAQFGVFDQFLPAPSGARAVVASIDGSLFRVAAKGNIPLQVGDEIAESDEIRTAKNSRAVLELRDGSRVELSERAQVALAESRGGKNIELARGNIIVQAAKQRDGYLRVTTDDCRVLVKGTIFSVNHGTKGSRVSVVEGQVAVEQRTGAQLLHPGEQVSTHSSLISVPVEREIAWSANASEHIALMRELTSLRKEIESSLIPAAHSSMDLLGFVPEGTVVYLSIPNLAANLEDTYALFQERLATNPMLQQWWSENANEVEPTIQEALDKLSAYGEFLGEEVVVGFTPDDTGEPSLPYILAKVTNPDEFEVMLQTEVDNINAESPDETVVILVDDLSTLVSDGEFSGAYLLVHGDVFVASPSVERLQEIVGILDSGQNAFVESSFHSRIAGAYEDGIGFLLAVDLASLIEHGAALNADPTEQEALQNLGIMDVQHLIAERKPSGENVDMRAIVSFSGTRTGMASWLAEPAPMGALDFVSADATAATAFVVKDPVLLIEDLFTLIGSTDGEGLAELAAFEEERGISIRDDFAAPLGGEFVFAMDGPVLPSPAWKVIVEVYDAARFQQTLEWVVDTVNMEAAENVAEGEEPHNFEMTTYISGGRTFYSIVSANLEKEIHYVFVDSYLVIAPSNALLLNAIEFRETGYTLKDSNTFISLLPADGEANFSALFYQNFGSLLQPLAAQIPSSIGQLSEEDMSQVEEILSGMEPTLMYAYGEADQITLAGTGDPFSAMNLAGVMSLTKELAPSREAQSDPTGDKR